jgi:hypothetical protein
MFVVTPPARKQRSIAGGENRDSLQLTQETIDAAMVWTGTVPCPRFAFSNTLRLSQEICAPQARCTNCWIAPDRSRTSGNVWFDVQTGEGRGEVSPPSETTRTAQLLSISSRPEYMRNHR